MAFEYARIYSISTDVEYDAGIDTFSGAAYSPPDAIEDLQADNLQINQNVYVNGPLWDKLSSKGTIGQVLLSDSQGVFWGDVAGVGTPLQTIGIYDESSFQGVVANLNFVDGNEQNDLVKAKIGVNSAFADIIVSNRWSITTTSTGLGGVRTDIYRLSKVGVWTTLPQFDLDVVGTVGISGNFIVGGATTFQNSVLFENIVTIEGSTYIDNNVVITGFTTGTISTAIYALTAGVATYSDFSGIASYSSRAGYSTYSDFSGIATYADFSGIATYASRAGYATYSDLSGFSTYSQYSNISGVSTYSDFSGIASFSNFSGIASFAVRAGYATYSDFSGIASFAAYASRAGYSTYSDFSGIATYAGYANRAGYATYSDFSGIATYSDFSGIATYADFSGIATYSSRSGYATYSDFSGIATYADFSGIATYSDFSGIATYASRAGYATYSDFSGIASYSSRAGYATYSDFSGIATYASRAGYATYSDFSGIASFAVRSGYATYSDFSGIASFAVRSGYATYSDFSGIATYASRAGYATYSDFSGIATYADFSGIATYADFSGISSFSVRSGYATYSDFSGIATYADFSGIASFAVRAGYATYSDFSGIATYADFSGIASYSSRAGYATYSDFSGIATYSDFSGIASYSARAGYSTYSDFSGIATYSDFSGIATYSSLSGIASYAVRAGYATYSDFSGIATYSDFSGIATYSSRAGYSTYSDFSGVSTFIKTVQTTDFSYYYVPFVQNYTSTSQETLRVDSGISYNPGTDSLDLDGNINIDGSAAVNTTLKVGIGGTVITTTGIGSVGIGSTLPSKSIDLSKDVIIKKSLYDSNSNVGYETNFYQVPRAVLTQVGVGTTGEIIGGRFYDAANLIRLNLDFIAGEAVGFITSTDYKSPAFFLSTSNYVSCKDDIKDIFRAITYDITRGGNSKSVGAGLSYYNGNTLVHIVGVDTNGYSIKDASIAAIQKAVEVSRFVINNSYYPTSYQMKAINGIYADAGRLLLRNKDFIAAEAVQRTLNTYPSLTIPGGNQSCIDDIKLILDAIIYNLQFGGNNRVYDAARFYTLNSVLSGEETEAIYAYEQSKDIAIQVIRNETVTKASGTLNTFTQYIDATVLVDPVSPTCQNQASAITSFVGIVTSAIGYGSSTLPARTEPTISIPVPQVRDLTLQDDPDRGSNTDPDGCANVVSAITVCAGIVTTIIGLGSSAAPKITPPDGKIIWAPPGADSKNIIWVSKYGSDENGGRTEGDAKLTIGAACAIAEPGDTVMVRPGVYYENNPVGLRSDVTVTGQDLRLVTVVPLNTKKDVFHVRRGCLIENMNFACDTGQEVSGGAAVAFPPTTTDINSGKSYGAMTGYTEPGPATEGPSGRWRSPYIRNCTNFMPKSIGMKIDGNHADASTIGADLKSMVCDSFTQYNEAGIGVSITNNGYAQLVSIFTINCHIGIYCDTGGQCDLTNSNSSFGNFGLVAVGLGATEFTAQVSTDTLDQTDTVIFKNVLDTDNNVRRPYDGQALYFKIPINGTPITAPLRRLSSVTVTNGGSGYSASAPPNVTIVDTNGNSIPLGPEGIIAEVSPTINENGEIISIDVINSGRNYLPTQNMVVNIDGSGGATAVAVMEPIYYTVAQATQPTPSLGISTVTFNEFIPYLVDADVEVEMRRISRILTSGHSFEYIGTGTDINTSTPLKGAVPIKENEIVAKDGAQIPFTSTDQKGNFDIGEGIQIDQTTSTIRGRSFSKAIQAQVTPLILALR